MRKPVVELYFLLFAFCFLLFCFSTNAQSTDSLPPFNNVKGTLLFNQRYCGGARPSEEMLAMYDSLRPLPNTTIYLARKNGGKFIYKLVSDKNGNFKKRMRAGKYFVYMSRNYDQSAIVNFNPDCKQWMKSIFGEVEIINGEKKLCHINLRFGCDPCSPPRP
ncbi:MAG TPA: hypothetical protein VI757_12015 [Bacteroidia bacterium]|nr:hypothetical protein [Bacteroidia bacterium]